MRRANPLRSAILRIVRDEARARPQCVLVHTLGVDEDGRYFIHFSCLNHDASWRYYVHVYADTELAAPPDTRSELYSRCPARYSNRLEVRPEIPEEDSPAQASLTEIALSGEELLEVPTCDSDDDSAAVGEPPGLSRTTGSSRPPPGQGIP